MAKPAIKFLDRNDEIEQNSTPYSSINQTKSDKPSEFIDVDFSFNPKQNQHGAPSNSLNNQRCYLPIDDTAGLMSNQKK